MYSELDKDEVINEEIIDLAELFRSIFKHIRLIIFCACYLLVGVSLELSY